MNSAISIENIPFLWGIAFFINVTIGVLSFISIVRKIFPGWAQGCCCWIGWWSFANALAFLVNVIIGPHNPFSYHQLGILTETMMNVGYLAWFGVYMFQNWNVTEDHWKHIELMRSQIAEENIKRELAKEATNES